MKNLLLVVFVGLIASLSPVHAGPLTSGVNHTGLAVKYLDKTTSFFVDVLGWKKVGGDPDYPSNFVTDGEAFLTLWQVEDPATAVEFNRRGNVGLHHLAFTVKSLDALHALHATFLETEGVTVEFAPEFLGKGPTTHMMVRDPSGLRLEFVVPGKYVRDAKKKKE